MTMDKKLKRKWVKALRSGQYDQAAGKLCVNGTAFCCLGVLCDIQGAYWDEDDAGTWRPILPSGRVADSSGLPPPPYSAGLTVGQKDALIEMNDDGDSFKQIAKWIEKNL